MARRSSRSRASTLPDSPDAPKAPIGTLRALWPFVMRQRGLFIGWLLALACSSAATLSLPLAARQMIDQGFSSAGTIDRAFALLFVVAVVLALATAARFYFVSLLGERVVADLRDRLYAHLLGLDGEVGNLQPGCEGDFVVLNPQATPLLARRTAQAGNLDELLFAMIVLGDDRLVEQTVISQAKYGPGA